MAALPTLEGSDLDTLGVTLLRQVDSNLTGSGVRVAQVEAPYGGSGSPPYPFEVNPSSAGQFTGISFTYLSSSGTNNAFPNSVGVESGHADSVGWNYYGINYGVATQVSHVANYEANYFYNNIILANATISDPIVNQSFIFGSQNAAVDQAYDDYAANHKTLFASGAGNSGPPSSPATCFNGLGVAAYGGTSSIGPTTNGGRCKPDITAPASATSFSTPYVAGAAAVLLQAANRGDGGANTAAAAADPRTLKTLLFNGAVKPNGWTNSVAAPLDARYGAGIANLFNSWKQLCGGQHSFIETTSNTSGSPHLPGASPNNEPVLVGWDYNSITNLKTGSTYKEQVNHYYFNLNPYSGNTFSLTATLVWNRQATKSAINDLNLFLYNTSNSSLVMCSTSLVDNVEHIFLPALPKGRYDLQVQKNAVSPVTTNETYALAFEIFNLQLVIARTNNNNVRVAWPIYPAGFTLQSATSLTPPISWTTVSAAVTVTNNQNVLSLPSGSGRQFLRLQRP